MRTLGTLLTALAFLNTGQLLDFAVQLLDHLVPLIFCLNNRRVDGPWGSIGNHPVNVTVWGDHLEKLHFEGNFFELDRNVLLKLLWRPLQIVGGENNHRPGVDSPSASPSMS